jgi:beta-glucosidase
MLLGGSVAISAGPGSADDTWLESLTTAQKAELLYGAGPWHVGGPAQGPATLVMTDGPNGARGVTFHTSLAACFPCETALAATWDPELVTEVANALGAETRRQGASMLLGPAVNLQRTPLGGRNFECFAEDPELTARMAVAYVTGVQQQGVACVVKHLVCNDQETGRHTASSEVDEATLREVYLVPFEAAAKAGTWAIMAAYNRLNGAYATEHPWLLTTLLREEWGWDGVVVSDWYATQSTAEALNAGLDLEMPGPSQLRGDKLLKAIADGEVTGDTIDRSARRMLRLLSRVQNPPESIAQLTRSSEVNHAIDQGVDRVIRRAGARGVVLLRNTGNVLPLGAQTRTVAVIGPGGDSGQAQGGGSCEVNPPHVIDPVSALRRQLPDATVTFARGCVDPERPRPLTRDVLRTPDGAPGALVEYRLRSQPGRAQPGRAEPGREPLHTEIATSLALSWLLPVLDGYESSELAVRVLARYTPPETGAYQVTLAAIGASTLRVDGETVLAQSGRGGADVIFDLAKVRERGTVELTAGQEIELVIDYLPLEGADFLRLHAGLISPAPPDLAARACELAAAADVAVVVVEHPPGVETEGQDRVTLSLPEYQNKLVYDVCAANPRTVVVVNTGSPIEMPWADRAAAIVQLWYPGQELGDSLADVLTGVVNPSGKLPVTFPVRAEDVPSAPYFPGTAERVEYGEGLAVGYRGMRVPPLFPFGFGLSYSTFELGEPRVDGLSVTVPVTNTSDRDGREVLQLYARLAPGRPFLELKTFASAEIPAGQTVDVRLDLDPSALRVWSDGWKPVTRIEARIGTSSSPADQPITVLLNDGALGEPR